MNKVFQCSILQYLLGKTQESMKLYYFLSCDVFIISTTCKVLRLMNVSSDSLYSTEKYVNFDMQFPVS